MSLRGEHTLAAVFVHQIFYDEASRQALDIGFIPLDNTGGPHSDWFEFAAIRGFLHGNALKEEAWYGFLSPKFTYRTGVTPGELSTFLNDIDVHSDVALVSHGWDQMAYFLNPFEQGEFWHPGLCDVSERFAQVAGIDLAVRSYVAHSLNTVFSNYVIAKPAFWRRWIRLADILYQCAEDASSALSKALSGFGMYDTGTQKAQLKVFLQERIAPMVLATQRFRVAVFDTSARSPLNSTLFDENLRTRRLLGMCDTLKLEYTLSGDAAYMDMFHKVRMSIPTRRPIVSYRPRP